MIWRFAWVLALTCGCTARHSNPPAFELPEVADTVEAKDPWTTLLDATASRDPAARGRALDVLIRYAPAEYANTFVTVALFDPQPWVTGYCVEGITERDPTIVNHPTWSQKLIASRHDAVLLGKMLSATPRANDTQREWFQGALTAMPPGGARAPLSRAAWQAGVQGASEMYCADLRGGDLPMDTAWLLQLAEEELGCIDEALNVAGRVAEPEIQDILSVVQVKRGTRSARSVLREHLTGSTERQLERLDAWIESGALTERAARGVVTSDPVIAFALRIAVAEGRELRSLLRDAPGWTDHDLIELSLALADRATVEHRGQHEREVVAVLTHAAQSPRSATRASAIRALAQRQSDHPRVLAAAQDTSDRVRLEAAVAIWRTQPVAGGIANPKAP